MPDEQQIQQFVIACQNGDQEAFGRIYDEYIDRIYRYIYYKVDAADVEDLTETTFVKAWENIRKYRRQECQFSSWLFRIAHNTVVDHYRMNHTIDALVDDYQDHRVEHNPASSTQRSMNRDVVRDSLKHLKDIYQQVLVLKFLNNLSNTEIAQILGKSEGSLRILQYRALRALRKVLESKNITY